MTEIYKTIPNWESYEVSSEGRVRRVLSKKGLPKNVFKVLKACKGSSGYLQVVLYRNGRRRQVSPHILVLEAFVGPRPKGQECRHINGTRTDNRLENLCYGTRRENWEDSIRHGAKRPIPYAPEEPQHMTKLSKEQIRAIREEYAALPPESKFKGRGAVKALAAKYGITKGYIWAIAKGKTRTHI